MDGSFSSLRIDGGMFSPEFSKELRMQILRLKDALPQTLVRKTKLSPI